MSAVGCEALDEFFDGEVTKDVATSFRQHLVDCALCSQRLLGRMQEAIVTDQPTDQTNLDLSEGPAPPSLATTALSCGCHVRRSAHSSLEFVAICQEHQDRDSP